MAIKIVETATGYQATSDEFPDLVVSAPTFGLCESLAVDAVNDARHQRDVIKPAEAMEEEALMQAIQKAEALMVKRGRGRPPKPAPAALEGADVPDAG